MTITPVRDDGSAGNTVTPDATIVYSPVGQWLQVISVVAELDVIVAPLVHCDDVSGIVEVS